MYPPSFLLPLVLLPFVATTSLQFPLSTTSISEELDTTPPTYKNGTGHLSSWSRATKQQFLSDLKLNKADDWTLVMGNEGGG